MKTNKKEELDYLKKRSCYIMQYIIELDERNQTLKPMIDIIEKGYINKDLRGLRILSRETNAWGKDLPKEHVDELNQLLLKEFGEDLSGDKNEIRIIKKVLKQKGVKTLEEYRIIHDYLSDMVEDDKYSKHAVKFGDYLLDAEKTLDFTDADEV